MRDYDKLLEEAEAVKCSDPDCRARMCDSHAELIQAVRELITAYNVRNDEVTGLSGQNAELREDRDRWLNDAAKQNSAFGRCESQRLRLEQQNAELQEQTSAMAENRDNWRSACKQVENERDELREAQEIRARSIRQLTAKLERVMEAQSDAKGVIEEALLHWNLDQIPPHTWAHWAKQALAAIEGK